MRFSEALTDSYYTFRRLQRLEFEKRITPKEYGMMLQAKRKKKRGKHAKCRGN